MTLKAYQNAMDEITRLREHLRMYEAECAGLRAAGFENAQDLFTSYEGVRQKLEAEKAQHEAWEQESLQQEAELRRELAARDLVIKQMREALRALIFNNPYSGRFADVLALQPTTEALDAYVEQYKTDAERYRWLVENCDIGGRFNDVYRAWDGFSPFDEAIDKARSKK